MPTYDYKCLKCGRAFEEFHSMTATPRIACPKCGGEAKRQIGAGSGILFKGSGFYQTDYRKKDAPKAPSENKENKPETAPKGEKG